MIERENATRRLMIEYINGERSVDDEHMGFIEHINENKESIDEQKDSS